MKFSPVKIDENPSMNTPVVIEMTAVFVVVEGLNATGLPDSIYTAVHPMFGHSATTQAWNLAWFGPTGRADHPRDADGDHQSDRGGHGDKQRFRQHPPPENQ